MTNKNKQFATLIYQDETLTLQPIETVKKGEYFKLSPTSEMVYIAEGYNRYTRKYAACKFTDVNHTTEKKKGFLVFTNFTF